MSSTNCPICAEPCVRAGNAHFPFCSERCQLVDLSRWLNEDYYIPGGPADEDDSDDGRAPDPAH